MTYGQVAAAAGSPRAARQVGGILRATGPGEVPWWRVLNAAGQISIKGNFEATAQMQKELLEAEGVELVGYELSLARYQYRDVQKTP